MEVCELYHWTVEYVLRMPAKLFFTCLEDGVKLRREREAEKYRELCGIAFIGQSTVEYKQSLEELYYKRYNKVVDRSSKFELDDPIVFNFLKSAIVQKRRLMFGR